MKYEYEADPVGGIGPARYVNVYRPTIPVHAIGPAGWVDLLGLVDTGADDTPLPGHLIEQPGVVVRPSDRAVIVAIDGGTVLVHHGRVDLMLPGPGGDHRWSARVGFHASYRTILGHAGFLEHFTATFNGRRRHLTLTPNGTASPPGMVLS